jgi:hypothetical protein
LFVGLSDFRFGRSRHSIDALDLKLQALAEVTTRATGEATREPLRRSSSTHHSSARGTNILHGTFLAGVRAFGSVRRTAPALFLGQSFPKYF